MAQGFFLPKNLKKNNIVRKVLKIVFCLLVFSWLLTACTGSHRLPKGQLLYTGAKLKIKKGSKKWEDATLKTDLSTVIAEPAPNRKVLGTRRGVWVWTHTREKSWFRKKYGSRPVLYSEAMVKKTEALLRNRAQNNGQFDVTVTHRTKIKSWKKRAKVIYTVQLTAAPYLLEDIQFPITNSPLAVALQHFRSSSLLKTGARYRLADLRAERERLAKALHNEGFYYFKADDLLFKADTNALTHQMTLQLTIKNTTTPAALKKQYVREIRIYPDYHQSDKRDTLQHILLGNDTCKTLFFNKIPIKVSILDKAISLQCAAPLNVSQLEQTFAQLSRLNVFQFIDMRPVPSGVSDTLLDVDIRLTPFRSNRLEAHLEGVFVPQIYAGGQTGVNWVNRNTFGGAERLRLSLEGQLLRLGDDEFLGSGWLSEIKTGAELTIPLFPRRNTTRTPIDDLRFAFQVDWNRLGFDGEFGLHFIETTVESGYIHQNKRQATRTQILNPISFSYEKTFFTPQIFQDAIEESFATDTFGELILLLPAINYSPNYQLTLDNRSVAGKQDTRYFRQLWKLSTGGYLFDPAKSPFYDQTLRFILFSESDFRYYKKATSRLTIANRAAFRIGIPLTKTSFNRLAYNELYWVGGANSLRAFRPRQLGPGSSSVTNTDNALLGVKANTGNLAIEYSFELRQQLSSRWEAAFFADAGNVWNTQATEGAPGAEFAFNRFWKELGIGTGVGIRMNIAYIVLRLDLATAIYRPDVQEGQRWVRPQLDKSTWWSRQTAINFAIGHPF